MRIATPAELSPIPEAEAPRDCPLCPRLVAFREECRVEFPTWWNAPVPAFGDRQAWLAIVGLAPGKHGANRTGRPFTGDYAGELLYATLLKFGLAEGEYGAARSDGLHLKGAIILNAVKCLPPASTKFGHCAEASAPDGRILLSSYHCSRYNQNTGRLNTAMFESVFERATALKYPR
jgi:uracil-DNA glycosylase